MKATVVINCVKRLRICTVLEDFIGIICLIVLVYTHVYFGGFFLDFVCPVNTCFCVGFYS